MAGVSRRTFLGRGSMAVAAAGVLSTVPGLSGLLSARARPKRLPPMPRSPVPTPAPPISLSLSSHTCATSRPVRSVCSTAPREVIVRNPQLASQLARAVR